MFRDFLVWLGFEPDEEPKPNEAPNARLSQIAQIFIDLGIILMIWRTVTTHLWILLFGGQ